MNLTLLIKTANYFITVGNLVSRVRLPVDPDD